MLQQMGHLCTERQVFDVAKEMTNLTSKCQQVVVNVDVSTEANTLRQAFLQTNSFSLNTSPYLFLLSSPASTHRRFWSAVQTTEAIVL